MPQQVLTSVENNFTKGLITEFTGLNFPENAATSSSNTEFTIVGDVVRREGIDFETNFTTKVVSVTNQAISNYKWNNVGGDGTTQIVVEQIGSTLYFYRSSSATTALPLSNQLLASTIVLSNFIAAGGVFDASLECQYADGNGYLFIFHPSCDPIYCSYASGVITSNVITIQIRDFTGVIDNLSSNARPSTLTNAHLYNLSNQGWTAGAPWSTLGTEPGNTNIFIGSNTFNVSAGLLTPAPGNNVNIVLPSPVGFPYNLPAGYFVAAGTVTSYSGTTMVINITSINPYFATNGIIIFGGTITPTNQGYINAWFTAEGTYPSNADVWWYFKNTSGVFDPTVQGNISLGITRAPRGHFLLNAFNQQRSIISSVSGITDVTTTKRPRTGCWFQGRVWYTGIDSSQASLGTANSYSWTEQIYFSQVISDISQFGNCYQTNDPTSEQLFDLLPTDGGVIQIQGCGSIYKLFPIQNGMLVFASNGVWFITGSQGIGFSANDYTITKISKVQSISSTSFVDVLGLPYFWNEEGIYSVEPTQGGALQVSPITVGTILSFYNNIPITSKKYVKGDYHPLDYNIQWIYKSTVESSVTDRYTYDSILNFNTYNKAFFPYSIDTTKAEINSILYVNYPTSGVINAPLPGFKYFSSSNGLSSFADEHDPTFVDWSSQGGTNYKSTFTTGFKLHGQGMDRFQIPYIHTFSRLNGEATSFYLQSTWDYANNRNSGRWSVNQVVNIFNNNYDMGIRRHRIRGRGRVLQLRVTSIDGMPFDLMGWALYENKNSSV